MDEANLEIFGKLLDWLDQSGWTSGHISEHSPTVRTEYSTLTMSVECRCREAWPCPLMRAAELVGRADPNALLDKAIEDAAVEVEIAHRVGGQQADYSDHKLATLKAARDV